MMRSAVVSGTIIAVLTITAVQAFTTHDVICDKYSSILYQFYRCIKTNNTAALPKLIYNLLEEDQIVTRDSLLTELDSMCSTVDIKQPYLHCAEMINNACPAIDIQNYVATNVEEREAVFCENNRAASWLREVLPNDFMFKRSCFEPGNVILNIAKSCERKMDYLYKQMVQPSYDEVLPILYQVHGKVFPCLIDEAERMLDRRILINCKISWYDMVLWYWLHRMSVSPFGPVITTDERQRLQEMMSNRPSNFLKEMTSL